MRMIFALLVSLSFHLSHAQNTAKYNLNFENYNPGADLPKDWFQWGSYTLETDSINNYQGKYSGKVVAYGSGNFGSIAYKIPANYEGDSIELTGYMKTLNVEDGFAGLLLRVDAASGMQSLVFNNMEDQNIKGTNEWKEYKIKLPYPKGGKTIYVAGLLVGKGTAWFDDIVVKIDGEDLQTKKEVERPLLPADKDREFDAGSKIAIGTLTDTIVAQLSLLGKVWGFLKYYHPEVGIGNRNWDYELFRILPEILASSSQDEFNKEIEAWIRSLGEIKPCKTCTPTSQEAILKPELIWIEESSLNTNLITLLYEIYNNRHQGEHYYFGTGQVGNVDLKNEKPYDSMPYPDTGFRLLALYRYWNIIQYFFPYKDVIGRNWNDVLTEYISKFIDSKNELEYELTTEALISEVNDTHAQISSGSDKIESWKGQYRSALHLEFVQNELVVTDYYKPELVDQNGPKLGDIITHINHIPVGKIIDSIIVHFSGSNKEAKLYNISRNLLRSNQETIEIHFSSEKGTKKTNLTLYNYEKIKVSDWFRGVGKPSYKMLENNIGYVTLQTISNSDVETIRKEFHNTRGIIIDIRNYPATFVPFALGTWFVSKPKPFAKFTKLNPNNPGEFNFTEPVVLEPAGELYKGKLVVLVNNRSISQSEYTAMAFRAGGNTTIIGNTTAGADGNISRIVLPGNISTIISGIGVYYPDGTETQRVGIVPDIEVWPTIKGIREGRDELLEKAIEVIMEK